MRQYCPAAEQLFKTANGNPFNLGVENDMAMVLLRAERGM
jgi:hypothetical protein